VGTLVPILLATILSLISAIGCLVLYLRSSRAREIRTQRLVNELQPFIAKKTGVTQTRSQSLALAQKKLIARIIGFRSLSRAHQKSGMAKILLKTLPVACVALFAAMRVTSGLVALFVFVGGWICCARFVLGRIDDNYSQKLFHQLPDALGMIVRTIRVGVPLSRALVVVSQEAEEPTASEFRDLITDVEVGRELPEALAALSDRTRLQDYRYFATVMALQSQTGGTLADVLSGLADIIRQRIALKKRGHALSGEARLSSYIIGGLPFFLGTALYIMNPQYFSVFINTHTGNILLGVAAFLLTIGLLSIRFLMKRMLG